MSETVFSEFHIHFYFTPESRDSALQVRERMQTDDLPVLFGRIHDKLVGPHLQPMFSAVFKPGDLDSVLDWLLRHHRAHSVLIHPDSGYDVIDHSLHAIWLGKQLEIDFSKL